MLTVNGGWKAKAPLRRKYYEDERQYPRKIEK